MQATIDQQRGLLTKLGPIGWYKPLPAPKLFHKSKAKFRWLFGGNRSGKSEGHIGYDIAAQVLNRHKYRKLNSEAVVWACAPTWEMVGKVLWQEKLERYIPACDIALIIWHNKQAKIPKEIELVNGNILEFKAYEQGREIFQGRAVDYIGWDEQGPEDIFIECQARLMDRKGSFGLSATPIKPQPWLEDRIEKMHDTDEVFYADLNDNRISRGGYIDDSEIDAMILQWPSNVRDTRVKGLFASFIGQIYTGWEVLSEWPERFDDVRYGLDFGFVNPTALIEIGYLDACIYLRELLYEKGLTNSDLIDKLRLLVDRNRLIVGDCAEPDRIEEIYQANFDIHPCDKGPGSVCWGIDLLCSKKVYIHEQSKNLRKEYSNYRWREDKNGNGIDEPVKLWDHGLDGVRYGVSYGVKRISIIGSDESATSTAPLALLMGTVEDVDEWGVWE